MSTKSEFSVVGLAHKLLLAMERKGFSPAMINELAERPNLLRDLRHLQLGEASVQMLRYIVNGDADPTMPELGWEPLSHVSKIGRVEWFGSMGRLYSPDETSVETRPADPEFFFQTCRGGRALNANFLDYIVDHQHDPQVVPVCFRAFLEMNPHGSICFWGTIYMHPSRMRAVRCLIMVEGKLHSHFKWVDAASYDKSGFDWTQNPSAEIYLV